MLMTPSSQHIVAEVLEEVTPVGHRVSTGLLIVGNAFAL